MISQNKYDQLKQIFRDMDSLIVAYSGGIDSTLVLKVAYDCLGDRVLGVTALSASMPAEEQKEAQEIARQIGVAHTQIISHETEDARYLANAPDRCFFCKSEVYDQLVEYAQEHGFQTIADGSNADDVGDHRPGRQAAREHGVRSPLQEAGFTKAEVRELARELGLPNWDKPAAACLASRIPYGTLITIQTLSQVEQAEAALKRLGFKQLRVRHHDNIARIEIEPDEFARILNYRDEITRSLKNLGYAYITLDLEGFRSGSMNEVLVSNGYFQNS